MLDGHFFKKKDKEEKEGIDVASAVVFICAPMSLT